MQKRIKIGFVQCEPAIENKDDFNVITPAMNEEFDFVVMSKKSFLYGDEESENFSCWLVPLVNIDSAELNLLECGILSHQNAPVVALIPSRHKSSLTELFALGISECVVVGEDHEAFSAILRSTITRHQALLKSPANREREARALCNLAHELRTPLNAVVGFSHLLTQSSIANHERDKVLRVLRRNAEQIEHLLNELLEYNAAKAALPKADKKPFSLIEMIEDLIFSMTPSASAKGLNLYFSPKWPLPRCIRGDMPKVQQILTNLIGNSVKFTQKGSIEVQLTYNGDNSQVRLSVIDSGPGMERSTLDNLFAPYFRGGESSKSVPGFGLGLSITKQLTESLEGSIFVESERGKGSTFHVELPVECLGELQHEPMPSSQVERNLQHGLTPAKVYLSSIKVDSSGPTSKILTSDKLLSGKPTSQETAVLVVDDDENQQYLLGTILASYGLRHLEASDSQQALKLAVEPGLSLILLDLRLGTKSGRTVAYALRDLNVQCPIVAMSAALTRHHVEEMESDLFYSYLSKPIDFVQLERILIAHCLPEDGNEQNPSIQTSNNHQTELAESLDLELDNYRRAFAHSFIIRVSAMLALLSRQDWKVLAARAHQLSGSAALFGFEGLARRLIALEQHAERSNHSATLDNLRFIVPLARELYNCAVQGANEVKKFSIQDIQKPDSEECLAKHENRVNAAIG